MKKKALTSMVIGLSLVTAACGTSQAGNKAQGNTSAKNGKKIAYLVPTQDITYWQWVKAGVDQEAKKLGLNVVVYDSHNSTSEQLSNAKTAMTVGVDGIVLSPVSSDSATSVLNFVKKPLTFAAIGPDPSAKNYTSLVTSDDYNSGYEGGKYLCELVKKDGGKEIGVLSLPLDRTNAKQKMAGLQKACDEAGVKIVQVIQTNGLTVREATTEATDMLTAHPTLKGIYGMYDNAGIGAVKVLKTAGKIGKVNIVSSDGSPETISYIKDGSIAGIVVQEAVGQGITATKQLANALEGKKVTKSIPLPEPLITKENINSPDSQKVLHLVYPPTAGSY